MSDEREARLEKLEALREAGVEPYPTRGSRDITAADALARYDELQGQRVTVTVAGRLMALNDMGKSGFARIEDATGRIQLYFKLNDIRKKPFRPIRLLGLAGFLQASATLFTTTPETKTRRVHHSDLLARP